MIDGREIKLARSHYTVNHGQEECWGDCGGSALSVSVYNSIASYPSLTTRLIAVNGDVSKVADGPFYRNAKINMRDVVDGTSNTIFMGEHSSSLSDKTWVGIVPGAYSHPKITSAENAPESAAGLMTHHAGPSGGEVDVFGNPIIHPVNFPTLHTCQMYSEHQGGGHIMLMDASVRFLNENVDLLTFASISSIRENENAGGY